MTTYPSSQNQRAPQTSSEPPARSESKIRELRVAQTELRSGNKTGKVFARVSEGAVAFCVPRSEAEAVVSSLLRKELLKE